MLVVAAFQVFGSHMLDDMFGGDAIFTLEGEQPFSRQT
jgi:hypothetical protein